MLRWHRHLLISFPASCLVRTEFAIRVPGLEAYFGKSPLLSIHLMPGKILPLPSALRRGETEPGLWPVGSPTAPRVGLPPRLLASLNRRDRFRFGSLSLGATRR